MSHCRVCVCVFDITVNNIEDIGAQLISDGLKSLTSLKTLNLNGKYCVILVWN